VEFSPVALSVRLNQTRFRLGETLLIGVSARNPGAAVVGDLYFGEIEPDGITAVFVTRVSPIEATVTRLDADPRTFPALSRGDEFPAGVDVAVDAVLTHRFSGQEPRGDAAIFILLTREGALADGVLDSDDILALDVQSFTVAP
jgi:hypothetical protein